MFDFFFFCFVLTFKIKTKIKKKNRQDFTIRKLSNAANTAS